jgi:hypothetical protein
MLTKKKVMQTVSSLPDSFSIEEIIDRLVLLQKIETGIKQSAAGQTFSTVDAKARLMKSFS